MFLTGRDLLVARDRNMANRLDLCDATPPPPETVALAAA